MTWYRKLRIAPEAHVSLLPVTGWGGALLTIAMPFLILGLARYSFFAVGSPAPLVRIVMIGLLGWGSLVTLVVLHGSWINVAPDWRRTALLVAQAHLPLVAGAVAVYALSFALQAFTASRLAAIVAGLIWFPASLTGAYGAVLGRPWSGAALTGLVGFATWLMVVGRPVVALVGHLM